MFRVICGQWLDIWSLIPKIAGSIPVDGTNFLLEARRPSS